MSDPVRLLQEGADDFELELLRSAQGDAGSDRLMRRTLGAVAAAGTLTAASAAGQAAVVAKAGGLSLLKWIGIGALAGVGVVTTYAVSRPDPAPAEPARAAVAPVVVARGAAVAKSTPGETVTAPAPAGNAADLDAPAPPPSAPPAAAEPSPASPTPARAIAAAPAAPDGAGRPAATEPAAPREASPTDARASLRAEVASLDKARGALGRGDGAGALRELDRHAAEFPRGALGPEATVLRIDALTRTGQRAAAEALAERFLASPAHAAHATRVHSILHGRAASSNP
jgi:hypothetical protein